MTGRRSMLLFVLLALASVVCAQINFSPGWGKRSAHQTSPVLNASKRPHPRKEILMSPALGDEMSSAYGEQSQFEVNANAAAARSLHQCKSTLRSLFTINQIVQKELLRFDKYSRLLPKPLANGEESEETVEAATAFSSDP